MKINLKSFVPIYEQIKQGIITAIITGEFTPGQALPSIRELSTQLLINPNTTHRAYRELEMEGWIDSQKGKGCYVSKKAGNLTDEQRREVLQKIFSDALEEAEKSHFSIQEIKSALEHILIRIEQKGG